MKRAFHTLAAAVLLLLGAIPVQRAWAQATTAQIANDLNNYLGDRIRFTVRIQAKLKKDPTKEVCVPPLTRMTVLGSQDEGGNKKSLIVKIADGTKDCDGKTALETEDAYLVTSDDLTQSGLARTGAAYGALAVPFKYQLTGNKDFSGNAMLGGYLGYRFETANHIGYTLTPVGFMGTSTISVPTNNGGQTTDQNLSGFSYGLGLIGTFKGAFQAGVVLGWDRVGKSAGYQYNGKPWLAVEIGYSFLQ